VVVFLLGIILLLMSGRLLTSTLGILGAGAWIAVVGFIDDITYSCSLALLAHFIGAVWGLFG